MFQVLQIAKNAAEFSKWRYDRSINNQTRENSFRGSKKVSDCLRAHPGLMQTGVGFE